MSDFSCTNPLTALTGVADGRATPRAARRVGAKEAAQ